MIQLAAQFRQCDRVSLRFDPDSGRVVSHFAA
jgi:hypothetical protein